MGIPEHAVDVESRAVLVAGTDCLEVQHGYSQN